MQVLFFLSSGWDASRLFQDSALLVIVTGPLHQNALCFADRREYIRSVKALIWYLIGTILLSIYGGQVCPFLETLDVSTVFLMLLLVFLIGFLLRTLIFEWLGWNGPSSRPELWRLLAAELGVWLFTGTAATVWNSFWFYFPLESGLKLLTGSLAIGLLVSTLLTLQAEHGFIDRAKAGLVETALEPSKFVSISTQFLIFIASSMVLFSAVVLLLVYKDFEYVMKNPGHVMGRREVFVEIGFVVIVLLAGCFVIARQYAQNLRAIFELIESAFADVQAGKLSTRIPIVSRDELSQIAYHTNRMIQGLQEKEKIKTIFGKYVSPSVADRIMRSEQGTDLGGRELNAVVLFTDIRNFTTLSENHSPAVVVEILNRYFSAVVEAVHGVGGIVDKFIGDAAMAVFGMDGSGNAATAGVDAAIRIRGRLNSINGWLTERGLAGIDIGVGIHAGRVVAGNIGSAERLEYTVIGDAVNTASRIEGLTKTQSLKVLISSACYSTLPEPYQERFEYLGEFDLKGKAKSVGVYGFAEVAA